MARPCNQSQRRLRLHHLKAKDSRLPQRLRKVTLPGHLRRLIHLCRRQSLELNLQILETMGSLDRLGGEGAQEVIQTRHQWSAVRSDQVTRGWLQSASSSLQGRMHCTSTYRLHRLSSATPHKDLGRNTSLPPHPLTPGAQSLTCKR